MAAVTLRRTKFPKRGKKPSTPKLTEKQELFVKEYIVDFNATRAALVAGYSKRNAGVVGHEVKQRAHVQRAIDRELDKRRRRIEIDQDMVVNELAKIAFADMRSFAQWGDGGVRLVNSISLPDAATACIAEVSETSTPNGSNIRFKLHDKRAALELLGRHLGMFTDKVEVTGQVVKKNEHTYHIIQELVAEPDIANRIRENFRSRIGSIPSA